MFTRIIIAMVFCFPLSSFADMCANVNNGGIVEFRLDWSTAALGSGLGATGFSIFDSDEDGYPEILFGSGAGFGGNTSFVVAEFDAADSDYKILCQSPRYQSGIVKIIPFENSTITHGSLIALGDSSIEVIDHTLGLKAQLIPTNLSNINDLAVGDVDNDGEIEIAVLSTLEIKIYDANTFSYEQSISYGAESFALGQYTDQIGIEIALNTGIVLELEDTTITVLWDYSSIGFSDFYLKSGDIDNDGLDEIVAADAWYGLRTFNADLKGILWEHTADLDIDALGVYDSNADGIPEVIYGDGQWGATYGLSGNDGIQLWSVSNPEHGVTDVYVGNLDNDAGIELLWGAGFSSTGPDYLFVHDLRTDLSEWQSGESNGPYYAVAYGNIDNDGIPDRVFASFESQSGYGDGIVTAVSSATNEVLWQTTSNTFGGFAWTGIHDVSVADVDSDGVNEVIVGTDELYDGMVYILNSLDGSIKSSVTLEDGSPIYSVKVVDIDGDGDMEILAGGGKEHTGANGVYVYVIDGATATWVSTFPSLGNNWTDLWTIEPVDIDNDGNLEILALWDSVYVIDPDNNGLTATADAFSSVTASVDVFSGDNIVYLGGVDGTINTLSSDGGVTFIGTICEGAVNALETISPVKLAFTCGGKLGIYDVVGGSVQWQTSTMLDSNLGLYDRLVYQRVDGKNTLLTGGSRVYYFVEDTSGSQGAPVAHDGSFSGHFNEEISGVLSAEDPDGNALTFGIYQPPAFGTIEITNQSTGEFIYQPAGNYTGDVTFQFYVSNGTSASNLATVTLRLTNTVPTGTSTTISAHWNSLYQGQLEGSDSDGDPIRFEIVSQPISGALVLLDEYAGEFTYYNNSPTVNAVEFSYRVTDNAEWSESYTVTIQLTNTAPVATPIYLETYYAVNIATSISAQDDDGDSLTYELINAPSIGTANLTSEGLLTYETTNSQGYQVVIPYHVHDGKQWSEVGEIVIDVIGPLIPGTLPVYLNDFSASVYAGVGPLDVDFTLSADGGSGDYEYHWDFGDGTTANTQSPSHSFQNAGKYSVSVTITDVNDSNNFARGYIDVIVISSPQELSVDMSAVVGSNESEYQVDFNVTIAGGIAPYQLSWDFGDGKVENMQIKDNVVEVSHIYQEYGAYNVTVIVSSSDGVAAEILTISSKQVNIDGPDDANNGSDDQSGGGALGIWLLLSLVTRVLFHRKKQLCA